MPLTHIDTINTLDMLEGSALIQLVYVSSLTLPGRLSTSIFAEVEGHARTYNGKQGITGILCYGNGHFLQCIEGEKGKILALQKRIFADKRHKNVKVLLLRPIEQRTFFDWRMRMLFLERWLWSPTTKQQSTRLSTFLPFAPHGWSPKRTENFLKVIKSFDSAPHIKTTGITYNALGNMISHVTGPHQAFLIVQGVLAILLIVALLLLYI